MAEITIKFDLTFSRRVITGLGVAAVMLCAAPELNSESVVLSTYYPAPSGVYAKLITTGNAILARDAGIVGIGTTGPSAGNKLDVNGRMLLSPADSALTFNVAAGIPGPALSAPLSSALAIKKNGTEYLRLTDAGYLGVGTGSPNASVDVTGGDMVVRAWVPGSLASPLVLP